MQNNKKSPSRDLYNTLIQAGTAGECLLCKVIEGPSIGDILLLQGTDILWSNNPEGFLAGHAAELSAYASGSGCLSLDGHRIYLERIGGTPRLIICGGGHVAQALVHIMKTLNFEIWLCEDRAEFAAKARAQGISHVLCCPFAEALRQIPDSGDNYYVVMTRGHQYDEQCLRTIYLEKTWTYIGLMASRSRGSSMRASLQKAGASEAQINSLHSPIGLSIGAQTPEEIAISIAAELIREKARLGRHDFASEDILHTLTEEPDGSVLCTITDKNGSAPRAAGTKMLVLEDGSILGTVGGGLTEAEIIGMCMDMASQEHPKPRLVKRIMNAEDCIALGIGCGGRIEVFLEQL